MSKKVKENSNKKGGGLQKIIITAVSIIIVVIATLLGFGGDNEEEYVQNNSQVVYQEAESEVESNSDIEENSIINEEESVSEEVTVAEITFRNDNLLDEHYDKHGIEMGFASAEEYELAAYKVIINPDTLHKIEAEDGDDVYYLEATNEFVVVSQDGYIRTYFNPDAGIDYYNRQ